MKHYIRPARFAWLMALVVIACSTGPSEQAHAGRLRDLLTGGRASQRQQQNSAAIPAGLALEQISVSGRQRSYYVHIPSGHSGHMAAVFIFHGGQGNGAKIEQQTAFDAAADQYGFVAVYPNGNGEWNDGRETTVGNGDDVGFVLALINEVASKYNVDKSRVFATGASSGGMMTQRLACDATSSFAAFASVVANLPSSLVPQCRPSRPTPIVMFNGTDDRLMPWAGGEIMHSASMGAGGQIISTPQTVSFWRNNDGCEDFDQSSTLPDIADDGTRVTRHVYDHCRAGTEVVLYEIKGGGHAWPGTPVQPRLRAAGAASQDISATQIIVQFFQKYGL